MDSTQSPLEISDGEFEHMLDEMDLGLPKGHELKLKDTAPKGKGRAWVQGDSGFIEREEGRFGPAEWILSPGSYVVHSSGTGNYGLRVDEFGKATECPPDDIFLKRRGFRTGNPCRVKSVIARKV